MASAERPDRRAVIARLPAPLDDLRAFYRTGEEIELGRLPAGSARRGAPAAPVGGSSRPSIDHETARLADLVPGTYAVEALAARREIAGRGADDRRRSRRRTARARLRHLVRRTSAVPAVLDVAQALRCTVVQMYDWMASYTEPLGSPPDCDGWTPSNRPVSFEALRSLPAGIRAQGAVAHAYAPDLRRGPALRRRPIPKC